MIAYRTAVHRIAIARLISLAGGEAAYVALLALMYERTGSPYWASGALLAMIGIAGLASPLAGALGDRFDRRRVMIASDLAGVACFAAIALVRDPVLLVVLAGLASLVEAPFFPAYRAAIPNLVPPDEVTWANSTIAMGRQAGQLAGPIAGGLLVAAVGAGDAFLVNAVSFAVSAALVASVSGRFAGDRDDAGAHAGLSAGFTFVWRDHALRTITAAWSLLLFGVGAILVAEYPLARQFGEGSVGYGALVASWAAGGLLGTQLARRLVDRHGPPRPLVWSSLCMGAGLGVVAVSPVFALILVSMAVGGVGNAVANVAEDVLVQLRTPDAVRSRVMAASDAVVMGCFAASFATGGVLVDTLGPQPVYAFGALGALLAAAILTRLHRTPARGATAVAGD